MNIQVSHRHKLPIYTFPLMEALLRVVAERTQSKGCFLVAEMAFGPSVVAHFGLSSDEHEAAIRIAADAEGVVTAAAALGWTGMALPHATSTADAWLIMTGSEDVASNGYAAAENLQSLLTAISAGLLGIQAGASEDVEERATSNLNLLVARVSQSPTHVAALGILVNMLCDRFSAVLCNVWRAAGAEQELRLIGTATRGILDNPAFKSGQRSVVPLIGTRVGEAITIGREVITSDVAAANVGPGHNMSLAATFGMASQICMPFGHGADRWVVVLGFERSGRNLRQIADDLRRLGPAVTMILRQRQREGNMELLSRVVEASREAVVVTRVVPGKAFLPIVYVNPAFTALTGYKSADVLGRTPRLLQCDETSTAERHRIGEALRLRQPVQAELLNRRRDGSRYWVDIQISPVFDGDGECTHFVSMQRDSTAEREARIARDERERAFREIFAANPVPMFIECPDTGAIIGANRAAEALYGYNARQFDAMTTADLLEPAERPAARRSRTRLLKDGECASIALRQVTADGRVLRVKASSIVLQVQGRPAVLTAIWDRTAQLAAEEATAQSEEKLRRMADKLLQAQRLAQLGTWSWSPQTGRLECSVDLAAMLGRPGDAPTITHAGFLSMIHREDQPSMELAFDGLRRGMAVSDIAFRVAMPGSEERVLLFSGSVEDGDHNSSCTGFCQDVTQRKQAEARLLRAEKLRSLGQLTGGIAHDWNNLLTVINANVEMALDTLPEHSQAAGLLAQVLRAADAGARLNGQLLSFASRQPIRSAPVALLPFLVSFSELARHTLGARFALVVEDGKRDLVNVRVDSAHLESALLNLCLNARDAMPKGGEIRISHGIFTVGDTTQQHPAATADGPTPGAMEGMGPGKYGRISVSDTGIGMTADICTRIFEPFFTTKAETGGTGLGLSMVLGFARQSGGGLSVQSTPGEGTSFHLYLPLADAPCEQAPAARPATAGPGWETSPAHRARRRPAQDETLEGRLLLVDDEPTLRASSALMLRSLGLTVDEAENAEDALARLAGPRRYDIMLSDVEFGTQPDGIGLCEQARMAWPDLAILLTSGHVEAQLGAGTLTRLRAGFLAKPYRRRALREAVADALRKPGLPQA